MPTDKTTDKNLKIKPGFLQEFSGMSLLFLVALNVFSPMFFMGKAIFHRDFHFITYPFRHFLGQAYQQGAIPYWSPHVYGGMPFMSLFHPGVFYPPSILFFLKDTVLATNLFYFIHFLVLGIFTFLLGKLWRLSFAARLCSSVTGMLSGFIIGSVLLSNYFMAAVWLPMIFWLYLKFRQEKHIGYFIGTVLALAAQTLASCPEISVMTVVLLFLHQIWFAPKEEGVSAWLRMTFSLGLAVFLALGLSALQLWPSAKLMPHSPRALGMNYEAHSTWSLEFSKLATLVLSPGYIGDSSTGDFLYGFLHTAHMGLLALVFILIGFFLRKEKCIGFWLMIFLFGLFFALGKYNPLYEYIYHSVPLLKMFRFPSKYFFVSSFAAIFLTGYVLDYILKHTESRHLKIIPVLSVLIIIFGMVGILGIWQPTLGIENSMVILFVFGLIYILFYFGKIKKTVFTVVIFLLIFIDLSLKEFNLLPLIDRSFYEEKPVYMKYLQNSFGKHRIFSGSILKDPDVREFPNAPSALHSVKAMKQFLAPYTGMVYGVENVKGRPGLGLGLKYQLVWMSKLRKANPEMRLRILERSNVKYWINLDQEIRYNPDGEPVTLPDRIYVLKDALPRAYLVPNMRVLNEMAVLNTYYAKTFDPLKEVLLSEAMVFQPSDQFQGQVEQVDYQSNHVTIKTRQEGNGFLVLNDTYFPGWTVTVDGQEGKILKANHYYRAVQLGPGEHTLEFDYFPEGFKEGLIASSIFLLILIVLPLCKPIKRLQVNSFLPPDSGSEKPLESDITPNK
jgi:Bacterial membrane protein YfhO